MVQLYTRYVDRCICVIDEGRTQIAANSFTVLAFYVMPRSQRPAELAALKLLA
jgi:hypothetical protein